MSVPRLSFDNVSRRFTEAGAGVHDLSFELSAGEVLCLLGPSGSGKSTTLRLAAGLERPDDGTISINGRAVATHGKFRAPEKRSVGLIFQDFALFPHLTVLQNILFGLKGREADQGKRIANSMLQKLGLAPLADAFPNTLSGGEQQRVALGRALAPNPRVMLMDEPFSDLDTQLRDQVRSELLSLLKETGAATVLVTHDPEEALRVADRVLLLKDGREHQIGTPEELYFHPVDTDVAAFFGDINIIHSKVVDQVVVTPLGEVSANGHQPGTQVEVLVRPVDIRVGDNGMGCKAEVISRRLAGGACLLALRVENSALPDQIIAQVDVDGAPQLGDHIQITINPAHSHVFPCRKPL